MTWFKWVLVAYFAVELLSHVARNEDAETRVIAVILNGAMLVGVLHCLKP